MAATAKADGSLSTEEASFVVEKTVSKDPYLQGKDEEEKSTCESASTIPDQATEEKTAVDPKPQDIGSKRDISELKKADPLNNKRQKQDGNESDGDDEKGSGKYQKRMMAVQFGYVGTDYAGLQK
jgi:hypothetical protein